MENSVATNMRFCYCLSRYLQIISLPCNLFKDPALFHRTTTIYIVLLSVEGSTYLSKSKSILWLQTRWRRGEIWTVEPLRIRWSYPRGGQRGLAALNRKTLFAMKGRSLYNGSLLHYFPSGCCIGTQAWWPTGITLKDKGSTHSVR